jgi:hypothetical protein
MARKKEKTHWWRSKRELKDERLHNRFIKEGHYQFDSIINIKTRQITYIVGKYIVPYRMPGCDYQFNVSLTDKPNLNSPVFMVPLYNYFNKFINISRINRNKIKKWKKMISPS